MPEPASRLRLSLGAAALLPLREAARLLPMRDRDGRSWLRAEGLVRRLEGRDVVIWGDVLDRLREREGEPPTPPRPSAPAQVEPLPRLRLTASEPRQGRGGGA